MSVTINNVVIQGRLGKDPETRFSGSGTAVTTLVVATNRKSQGEEVTDWHTVKVFKGTAEWIDQNARKGDQVTIVGLLTYNRWEKDGVKHYDPEILANTVSLAPKSGVTPAPVDQPQASGGAGNG